MLPNRILAVIKAVHERVPETYARVILGGLGIPGTDASGLTQTDMLYSNITVPSAKVNNFSLTTDSRAAVNTLPVRACKCFTVISTARTHLRQS